ncbi:MAG: cytochrome c [Acidimicrobiales bacterium]
MTFKRLVDVVQYLVLAMAVVFVIALFTNDGSSRSPTTAGTGGAVAGDAVFASNCAGCHGADGRGGVGPALADGAVVEAFPDAADQVVVITEGRNGMPAFGERLTAAEIQAVTDYTRGDL